MLSGLSFSVPLSRALLLLCAAVSAALLTACVSAPSASLASADPSDPHVRGPAAAYQSAFQRYSSQRPVEPSPWREQNERVAPQPKP